MVIALDQLLPRSRYVQAGALYAANALSGETLRAFSDEGNDSFAQIQELFDLAGRVLDPYEEVSFIRPAAASAAELYLELASIRSAMAGAEYNEFVIEFADPLDTDSGLGVLEEIFLSAPRSPARRPDAAPVRVGGSSPGDDRR